MFVTTNIRKYMSIKRKKNRLKKNPGQKKPKQTRGKPMDLLFAKIHFH